MSEFKTQLFGYKKKDVDQQFEIYDTSRLEFEETIRKLEDQLSFITEQNTMLAHRVSITEKTNEEISRLALKEASELIEKAKRNADMILKESLEYVRSLSGEIDEFKEEAIQFRDSVQKMSKEIIESIDNSEVFHIINEDSK